MPEQFKLRDLVEVTVPGGEPYYAFFKYSYPENFRFSVVSVDFLVDTLVKPEWCRLVPMTLIIKDGEWRVE